ncbi:MAG: hypothetical protein LAO08_02965 [Acidobacteriia bacterium]|nr:hypothetical protein [Terriglobia bacterium]
MLPRTLEHDSPRSCQGGIVRLGFCVAICAACLSCAPIRKQVSGVSETREKIDLSFLQVGSTRREEVFEKLDWINTGIQEEDLFVGRWSAFSVDWVWGWAPPPVYGMPGTQENWRPNNLMVEFDARGVVKQILVLSDSDFLRELSGWVQSNGPSLPALVTATTITVKHRHSSGKYHIADLTLGLDSFDFREKDDASHNFSIARRQLSSLSHPNATPGNKSAPRDINCRLEFREATKAGSHLTLAMDVPSLFVLIEYVEQNRKAPEQRH